MVCSGAVVKGGTYSHIKSHVISAAYIKSTEDRLAPFRYRTMAVRGLLYGSIAGLGCAGLTSFGLLNL